MSWTNTRGQKGDWSNAKKGENLFDNNYQNNENEKPVETLLKLKPEAKPADVFKPAPKKW